MSFKHTQKRVKCEIKKKRGCKKSFSIDFHFLFIYLFIWDWFEILSEAEKRAKKNEYLHPIKDIVIFLCYASNQLR